MTWAADPPLKDRLCLNHFVYTSLSVCAETKGYNEERYAERGSPHISIHSDL